MQPHFYFLTLKAISAVSIYKYPGAGDTKSCPVFYILLCFPAQRTFEVHYFPTTKALQMVMWCSVFYFVAGRHSGKTVLLY
jgi:hypothetical protein